MPLERKSFFGRGEFEFNDHASLFADLLYADYSVSRQLAPTPAMDVFIPPTNPYIPAI